MSSTPTPHGRARHVVAWLVLSVSAWLALAALTVGMYVARTPPSAGFDLELLLVGGRRVAAGLTPYDLELIAGASVEIQSLFYSYPPVVAQALSIMAPIPSPLVFLVWDLAAIATAVWVAGRIERRLTGRSDLVLPTAALLPFWFPFAIALLFGNVDAWFAGLLGLLLIAVIAVEANGDRRPWRDLVWGGLALAIMSLTKIHPASLGLWLLVRGAHARAERPGIPGEWRIAAVSAVAGLGAVAASVVIGGVGPWADYLAVLRAGVGADLLDTRNLGPSVQVALAGGLDAQAVRTLQVGITIVALLATVAAAWRVRDPIESLGWATVASFVVLPVTWFHYPSALIPLAVAAAVRAREAGPTTFRRTLTLGGVGMALAIVGMGLPVMWLSVAAVLAAIRVSGTSSWSPLAARSQAASAKA